MGRVREILAIVRIRLKLRLSTCAHVRGLLVDTYGSALDENYTERGRSEEVCGCGMGWKCDSCGVAQ